MFEAVSHNLPFFIGGSGVTLKLTFCAPAGGIALGMLVGLAQILKNE